jgi:transketolase C-terminal domain/subunit
VVLLFKAIYIRIVRNQRTTVKRTSKWRSLGERVAQLKDGESIVLEPEGDPTGEARKIRNGLNGIAACILVQRSVKVVERKVVITRVGTWP